MTVQRQLLIAVLAASTLGLSLQNRKPSIKLTANPQYGATPVRIVVTADLRGGANDYEDFYCPTAVWEWGDGTKSEVVRDCEPYEAGGSEIARRYVHEHVYRFIASSAVDASLPQPSGVSTNLITFRLKQKDRVVAKATATIQLRPGVPQR